LHYRQAVEAVQRFSPGSTVQNFLRIISASIFLFIITCGTASAASETPASIDPFETLLRLAGSLVIVVGLIIGAALLSKKVFSRMRFGGGQARLLEVRQSVNLGGKRYVFVLSIGPSLLVVGAAGENMRLLAKLPKEVYDRPNATDDGGSFEHMISEAAAGRDAAQDAAQEGML